MNFKYWENKEFYRTTFGNKTIKWHNEKKPSTKKEIIGIVDISSLLKMDGHNLKIFRNEVNKWKKENIIKIKMNTYTQLSDIKEILKNWNKDKRHFISWKGQSKRFVEQTSQNHSLVLVSLNQYNH